MLLMQVIHVASVKTFEISNGIKPGAMYNCIENLVVLLTTVNKDYDAVFKAVVSENLVDAAGGGSNIWFCTSKKRLRRAF